MASDPTSNRRLFPRLQSVDLQDSRSHEAVLIRERKRLDRQTVRRIVEAEVDELRLRLQRATQDAEDGRQIIAMAEWSGCDADRVGELRDAMDGLSKEASI